MEHNYNKEQSSKKKKSKKEKKRKRSDDVASASPIILGSDNGINHLSDKKTDRKNKKIKANDGVTLENNLAISEIDQRPNPISQDSSHELHSIQPPTLATSTTSTTASLATSTPGQILIFSSIVSPVTTTIAAKFSSVLLNKSPYQIKIIQGSVALLPSSLPDVPKCIQSLLNSLLLMYDSKMGGVLLCLEDNVKVLPIDHRSAGTATAGCGGGNVGLIGGRIVDDLPYIHYHFQARGLLFCPKIGMKLKGQVVECTSTYITLTTHHILSTKIWTEKLHEQGFFYNEISMEWTREREATNMTNSISRVAENDDVDILRPSTSIYLDDIVEFVVDRILECGGYITLGGTRPSVSTLG